MKKRTVIIIHFLYWFYIINQSLFPMYIGKLEQEYISGGRYLSDIFISLLMNAVSFYAVYFAFTRITSMRNRLKSVLASLLLVVLIVGFRILAGWCFWKYIGQMPAAELKFQWVWVWNDLRLVIITGIYAILIRFLIEAIESQKVRNELIQHKQADEIALLKSQINPHFLFNTLNNIYSLVYHKSDEAPDAVIKFSSIMRYVIYDTAAEKIALDKEIEYLRSYIELQQLRYDQPDFVSLNITGDNEGLSVAPMLLIPFVENAFKNCSKNYRPGIIILLHAENRQIRFEVTHFMEDDMVSDGKKFLENALPKIRRRLELIYPGKNNLTVTHENNRFIVKLLIEA